MGGYSSRIHTLQIQAEEMLVFRSRRINASREVLLDSGQSLKYRVTGLTANDGIIERQRPTLLQVLQERGNFLERAARSGML